MNIRTYSSCAAFICMFGALAACTGMGKPSASQDAPPDNLSELTGAKTLDNGCLVLGDGQGTGKPGQVVCPTANPEKHQTKRP